MQPTPLISLVLLASFASVSAAEKSISVTVNAGEFERRGTVVHFKLPDGVKPDAMLIRPNVSRVPFQIGKDRMAVLVLDELKKGTAETFELVSEEAVAAGGVKGVPSRVLAERGETQVKFRFLQDPRSAVTTTSRPLLDYQAEQSALPRDDIKAAFKRGGYLHPIRTLSGRIVTDDFPPNHIHHHGVWWAWTKTKFDGREPDFWNMGDGKGRVEFVSLDDTWSGPVHGGFRSQTRFVDLTATKPTTALNESWQVTVYAAPKTAANYWLFDLISEQQCATDQPLKLPEYRYGGVGVRGNWAWNGKDQTTFLTSEGETDREKGNATRGRWCDMGGQVDGQATGIAILCHPENFRAPQPMRLHPTEPFFNFAPQQAGDMEIKPGQKFVSRYRFVVHDGPADRAELDRLWNDYAHPPTVTVN